MSAKQIKVMVVAVIMIIGGLSAWSLFARASSTGLVAAYNFDEGTGTTVTDTSGNNNTGTITGATWNTAGKYGKALSFNGSSNLVSIPDSASLDLTTGMTLESWVKPAALGSAWRSVILKEQSGDLVYSLYANNNNNRPAGYIYSSGEKNVSGTSGLPLNTWSHLAATYDGATLRLYVNGTLVSSKAQTGSIKISTGALRIGGNNVWGEWFNGVIDDVRIYNRAISGTEVQSDMNTPISSTADTTPPSTPTNFAQTNTSATSVTVGWNASTDNVGVSGYTLYKDGSVSTTTSNTTSVLTGLSCGSTYQLDVDAYDAAGNRSSKATITASTSACDTTAPTVNVTSPATGATVNGNALALSANAADNTAVAGVQFKVDGNNVGNEDTTSPYTVNWDSTTSPNGSHVITAVARDTSNNITTSAEVSITTSNDLTAPSVNITSPASGSTVSGSSVAVGADATDNVSVANVQFKLDGSNLGAAVTAAPYTYNWDSTTAYNGNHTLTAVATDTNGNITTSSPVTVSVSNASTLPPLDTTRFNQRVNVGPGFVEASARQIVRTSDDVVYVITADDNQATSYIRVWKGSPAGIPTSFTEVDSAHHPSSSALGSPDTRLDRSNVIQLAYNDESNHTLYYQTFDTNSGLWGTRTQLASNAATGLDDGSQRDRTGNVALVLGANDLPHIAYTTTANTVAYFAPTGSGTFAPVQTVASGQSLPIHPALAIGSNDVIHLAWVNNTPSFSCTNCSPDSPSATILYSQRDTTGNWSSTETVATNANNNVYLDQGPNIVVNSAGIPYVMSVSDGAATNSKTLMQIRYRTAANTWANDDPPSSAYGYTHTPTIYAQGNDIYAILGHDINIHYGYMYQLGGAGNPWGPYTVLDTSQNDGSASVRWDPFRENDSRVIDTIYFNEVSNAVYYMAIAPAGTGTSTPPSSTGDTTPPTVSVTGPSAGSTVSGSVTLSANANDDVGVAGVQFKVDGNNVGSEDTTAPYSVSWDSTTVSNGTHTITAVARDAAGNTTTSSSISVTVSNTAGTSTGQTLLGNTAVETGNDSASAGLAEAFRVTASASGTLVTLKLYVPTGNASTKLNIGLYSNNGTHPGSLLTQQTLTGLTAGTWNTVTIPSTTITAGTTYWIAVLSPSGSGTLSFRDRSNGGGSETSSASNLTSLPATWTTGTVYADGSLSAYGTN